MLDSLNTIFKCLFTGLFLLGLFILGSVATTIVWLMLLKYFDILLGAFSGNLYLTIALFCGTIILFIGGVACYVQNR